MTTFLIFMVGLVIFMGTLCFFKEVFKCDNTESYILTIVTLFVLLFVTAFLTKSGNTKTHNQHTSIVEKQ